LPRSSAPVPATSTRHDGPWWRHEPTIGEQLAIGAVWIALLVALGTLGVVPKAPFALGDWIVTYGLTLLAAAPAFALVELVHHRVVPAAGAPATAVATEAPVAPARRIARRATSRPTGADPSARPARRRVPRQPAAPG
jgi:hypothetical protein